MLEKNPVFSHPASVRLRTENAYVAALLAAGDGVAAGSVPDADRAALGALGFRYVVLQKDAFVAQGLSGMPARAVRTRQRDVVRAVQELAGAPVYDDARVAIFAPWGDRAPCDSSAWDRDSAPGPERRPTRTSGVLDLDEHRLKSVTIRL
jgi:hypothetical protein